METLSTILEQVCKAFRWLSPVPKATSLKRLELGSSSRRGLLSRLATRWCTGKIPMRF